MTGQTKERDQTLDVIKAVAILLMVFGHCIQNGSGADVMNGSKYFNDPIFLTIYSFHMPLFMLVSGYLFAFSAQKYAWNENLIRIVKTLLVPIFCWAVISFLLLDFFGNPMSLIRAVKVFISRSISDLWYLWALFYCSAFAILVRRFFRDSPIVYLAALLLTLLPEDRFGLALYKFMYPYFIIGYFSNKEQWQQMVEKKKNTAAVIAGVGVVFLGLLAFFRKEYLIYLSGYTIVRENPLHWLWIDGYRFSIGLAGSVFVIALVRIIVKRSVKWIVSVFTYIGRRTLGIYILSGYLTSYVLPRVTGGFGGVNYAVTLLETVLITAISLAGTELIRRIPPLNRALLGGR